MINTESRPRLKQCMILLMAFVMVLTYMPAETFAAGGDFGTHAYFRNGSMLVGSDGNYYYNDSRSYTNRYYSTAAGGWKYDRGCTAQQGPRHSYTLKSKATGTAYRAYCLEQDVMNPNSGNTLYSADQIEDIEFLQKLTDSERKGIYLALLYGAQPDTSERDMTEILGSSVEGCNRDDWYVATQAIIWEYQQNIRDTIPDISQIESGNMGTKSWEGTPADFFYKPIKNRPAGKVYRAMLKAMRIHHTVPYFTSEKENRPKNIFMEKVGSEWWSVNPKYASLNEEEKETARQNDDYYFLPDKNKITNQLKVMNGSSKDKRFSFERKDTPKDEPSRYKLVFKGEELPADTQHGKKDIKEATKLDCLAWNVTGGHYQTIAFGAKDPVDFYFKLTAKEPAEEPPEGECPANPKPDIEFFPEFSFPVHKDDVNPGWDGNNCTGMGDASLGSTFILKRDGAEVDRITLDVYGNTDTLSDIPWASAADIEGKDSGARDHIKGEPPAKHCTVEPTRCDWDDEVTYTIEEVVPEGRHPADFETTANLSGNTKVRGTYKVKYHAEAENQQQCIDCPENWTDIQYNIEITDASGKVTVLNGQIGENGLEYDFVHQFELQTYINDNYRGDLQIVKTKDDQDPFTDKTNADNGIKDYSTGSKWTIQLKSGGWENHPYIRVIDEGVKEAAAGEYERFAHVYKVVRDTSGYMADTSHPLEVSKDGQIYVYDLPYGTYEVKEISADAEGYVLETFEIVVNKHGQKISKAVNNQPKKNVIKVVKTNQETGKAVRWDADKTAFRIRYLGNPDFADPKESPNYGKLLPNGYGYTDKDKDYVFYADKNGEIVLPYQIEYGIYKIEELVVPEGYFVGRYDEKGRGTLADMGKVDIIDHKGQVVKPPKKFLDAVQVRDEEGKKVSEFKGDVKTVYNTYTFKVLEQDDHVDGDDYITYFAVIEMPNIPAKGKIEITKDGEALSGWNEHKENGQSVWKAVWDKIRQADTAYEIYAAKDIMQSDGVVPIKVCDAGSDEEIPLDKVSRDHADVDGAKEVREKKMNSGELITRTSYKDISEMNKTVTRYIIGALNGATYVQEFKKYDEEAKLTYHYTVEYKLNYSKGGFNYTDVHVTKKTVSDDYVAEIKPVTAPVLKSGDLELGFATMNYDNGNMVRMNRLDEEKDAAEEEVTGQHTAYNTDDLDGVEIVDPAEYEPKPVTDENGNPVYETDEKTGEPKLDENGQPVQKMTEPMKIVKPAGWTDYTENTDGETITNAFMVTKDGEYRIFVFDKERKQKRWIPCTEDQKFYLSYFQEYNFTAAQHFNSEEGFTFCWDDVIKMTTDTDHETETAMTVIEGFAGVNPIITESGVYTHDTADHITTFYGRPEDKAPVYFKTHDGIRTEMYLSGRLTHTRITVNQSQLSVFDKTYPMITFDGEELQWNIGMDPDNSHYEYIVNEQNYIKAERHEASPDNREAYYTIDIVSDHTDAEKGFRVIYPDTTTCIPIVKNNGTEAELVFESIDDTMVYPMGHPVQVIKTGLDGTATSKELPLGEYWVREIESNNGHVNAGEWKKFVLDYKDQYTPLVWDTGKYENEAVSVKIDLEKLFETAYESKDYKPGDGAVFGIFTAEEIKAFEGTKKDADVRKLPADRLVDTLAVKEGKASSTVKLPLGKYYIKEISAPEGYKLNGTKYYFEAVDVLTADDMAFHYKDLGISGFITQNGENCVVADFDVLYRHKAAKVAIDGREYSMDENYTEEGSNVSVVVNDGRTNAQVRINDGRQAVVSFENGSSITIKASGQAYTAILEGPAPDELELDPNHPNGDVNENFTVTEEGAKTIILYSPKVTRTNWLSEVEDKYIAPKGDKPDKDGDWTAIQPANTQLVLTSPKGTSSVKASVGYDYRTAELTFPEGRVTGITIDGEIADISDTLTLKRADKETAAVINFADGVSFTVQIDKAGNFSMTASGEVSEDLKTESVLTVNGSTDLPKNINLKNTTAKTYARNNTSAGVLNIIVKAVKNDKLPPENPVIPPIEPEEPGPGPSPDKPSIHTTAKDSETSDHIANADGKVTIIDTVEYRNLTPGKEYLLQGMLMDKETGKPILADGKEVTAEIKFTPETSNGKVDMDFRFDGSGLSGTATVVFEKLFIMADSDKDGKPDTPEKEPVAIHEDLKDEGQTVYFPDLKTSASHSEDGVITDVVSYQNLIPGREYTIRGILMNKAGEKPVMSDGHPVTAEIKFTPEKSKGTVEIEFHFKETDLYGKTAVVFEKLYFDGRLIGSHENIHDEDQTIEFSKDKHPEKPKTPDVQDVSKVQNAPKTGDQMQLSTYLAVLLIAITGITLLIAGKRRRK